MTDIFGPDDEYPGGQEFPGYDIEPLHEATWGDHGVLVGDEWEQNLTLYNDEFFPMSMTMEDWFEATLLGKEELMYEYGIDNLGIIRQLEAQGYWDRDDWALWREMYGEAA
jgi:hypothetical protein